MTIYELLQRLHTTLDEMDAALGVRPQTKAEVALERTRRIFAAAVPVSNPKRKRGRPKGSKNKPKEA